MTAVQSTGPSVQHSWWHPHGHQGGDGDGGRSHAGTVATRHDSWSWGPGATGATGSTGGSGATSTVARQRFSVDPGIAAAAAMSPEDVGTSVVDVVSGMLGLDPADLASRLQYGETLDDVADSTGTSRDDLHGIVRAALPDTLTDPAQADALAGQISAAAWPLTGDTFQLAAHLGAARTVDTPLTAVATLLGTSVADLSTQLTGGTSLATLADAAGVSHDDLVTAISADLPTTDPAWPDVTALAEQVAAGTDSTVTPTAPAPTGHHHHGRRAADVQRFSVTPPAAPVPTVAPDDVSGPVVDAVAGMLALPAEDVTARLTAGETLDDVAAGADFSHEDLVAVVRAALPEDLAAALTDPAQATALAGQIATATWPLTPDSLVVPPAAPERRAVDSPLTAVATLLGTTPADLSTQLTQGASLAGLAGTAGVSHSDLITAITADLPFSVPGWTDRTALAEQIAGTTDSTATPPATDPHHHGHHGQESGQGLLHRLIALFAAAESRGGRDRW